MRRAILWEPKFKSTSSFDLIKSVSEYLTTERIVADSEKFGLAILERERAGNTLLAPNLANPHVRSEDVRMASLLFIRLTFALKDWQTGQKVDRYLFTLIPEKCATEDLIEIKEFYIKIADDSVMNTLSTGNLHQIKKILEVREDEYGTNFINRYLK